MAKRRPLVFQYLENVSRDALGRYQQIIREYVRGKSGVYALYGRGQLYYVGLASNLRGRLTAHLRDRHAESWDRFSIYLTRTGGHLKELESLVLRIVRPAGNRVVGRFVKSENLRTRFGADIRESQRLELDQLFGRRRRTPGARTAPKRAKARKPTLPSRDLADHLDRAITIRASYKGGTYKARLRKDGTVQYMGRVYGSLSAAGAAITKRATNGRWFWCLKDNSGQWVRFSKWRRQSRRST